MQQEDYRKRPRRRHSAEFKALVVAACGRSGATVASVALEHGINANLARQWLRGRGVGRAVLAGALPGPAPAAVAIRQRFVAVPVEAAAALGVGDGPSLPPHASAAIEVKLSRGSLSVQVNWPVSAVAECASLLRELLR